MYSLASTGSSDESPTLADYVDSEMVQYYENLSIKMTGKDTLPISLELATHKEELYIQFSDVVGDREVNPKLFMQMFEEVIVPWCLHGNNDFTSARLDMLLALLNGVLFTEQWHTIIRFATDLERSEGVDGSLDRNQISILTMLLDKARAYIIRTVVDTGSNHREGSSPEHWHHELLDSAAISISGSLPYFRASGAQFLLAILGGKEDEQISLVSREAMILIFQEVMKKLLSFVLQSPLRWVRDAGSLLTAATNDATDLELGSAGTVIEMAQFALDVLDGSLFCLKALGEETELVSAIFAALFIIEWEMAMTLDDVFVNEPTTELKAKLAFGQSVHVFLGNVSNQFWEGLNADCRKRLSVILIQTIRSIFFKGNILHNENDTSLCCLWAVQVLERLCYLPYEEQCLLDQLLSGQWTLRVVLIGSAVIHVQNISTDIVAASGYQKFIFFINELILKLGIDKVIGGYEETRSRAWLAAEILCAWKWAGGSAVSSFLPSLSAYAKSSCSPQDNLLDSILNILLDGSLVYGGSGIKSSFNVWSPSNDEVESIEVPVVRALVSFLSTLFKDNIWGSDKAMSVFQLLARKLCIGKDVNTSCLKIAPLVIHVVVQPLCQSRVRSGDSDTQPSRLEELMINTIKIWLQRTLVFPPLTTWQTGEDMEEWFQLVISCYPVTVTERGNSAKVRRDSSPSERVLLLDLFRKQRPGVGALAATNELPVAQILLSKLIVVSISYCWNEFDDEDWVFVLSTLNRWIQSTVVMSDKVVQNVNDLIGNCSFSGTRDGIIEKLEHIVSTSDHVSVSIATNALLSFSRFSGLLRTHRTENENKASFLKLETLDPVKDLILEAILHIFFSTGIAEAVAQSYSYEAASIVASTRINHPFFWESVASSVVSSSPQARDRAVRSIEIWGLRKGPISSLYAILFSSKAIASLQFAAYVILSTEPVVRRAIIHEDNVSSEEKVRLNVEVADLIKKLPHQGVVMDLLAQERVHVFLAWSLLLSHLLHSSPSRESLIRYILEFEHYMILDCLFQHIRAGLSEAGAAARWAIKTRSLLFSVGPLWPIEPVKMTSLAGAIYGMFLHVLPAYVRDWFGGPRDSLTSSLIESFTRDWCSPSIIADELFQIKGTDFNDENFLVRVNKSRNVVIATYTKDDTETDLFIELTASYPLRPVEVSCTKMPYFSEEKQNEWLSSCMMLIAHNQGGALGEGIQIWKHNIDNELEGIEPCNICFRVFRSIYNDVPDYTCKKCKHKFHGTCMLKWVANSGNYTCPLCRDALY